jgi:hypothetical protein
MTDWATVSSLATAGGTLVLAGATFLAVRSAHESTRTTERALLAQIRPLLLTAQLDDPPQKVRFQDGHVTLLQPGCAHAEASDTAIYLAFGVHNAGSGIAVLDRWRFFQGDPAAQSQFDLESWQRLGRDLYIPASGVGFWQGALRDPEAPEFAIVRDAIAARQGMAIDVEYGDHEGGQRVISRFYLTPRSDGDWLPQVVRHWNVDRPDPR